MVSMIIPIYNTELYLEKCLNCCIEQTYKDLEIILVDDGSSDNSPDICDKYAKTDNRLKVFHKVNGGVSSARNLGLEKATGEYIVFVDSDDYIMPNMVQELLNKQVESDADLVLCNFITYENGVEVSRGKMPYKRDLTRDELRQRLLQFRGEYCFRSPWCKLFKKEIIDEYNIRFDESMTFGEDTLFNYKYLSRIDKVSFLPDKYLEIFNVINTSVKKKRYFKSANYVYESRMKTFDAFSKIFIENNNKITYEDELKKKYIYCLSILENVLVLNGFKRKEVVAINKASKKQEFYSAELKHIIGIRDKYTAFCLKHNFFSLLFYSFKLYSFIYIFKR